MENFDTQKLGGDSTQEIQNEPDILQHQEVFEVAKKSEYYRQSGQNDDEARNIDFSIPIPTQQIPPDPEKVDEWIDSEHEPRFRLLKQKLIDNLNYISFEEFKKIWMK